MSYFAVDATEEDIGPVASIYAWEMFSRWVGTTKAKKVKAFVNAGITKFPKELARELRTLKAPDPDVESVRQVLADLAEKADEILILSDGTMAN